MESKSSWKANATLVLGAVAALTTILTYLKIQPPPAAEIVNRVMQVEVPVATAHGFTPEFGWVPPNNADMLVALDPTRTTHFGDTPAGKAVMAGDEDQFMYRMVRKACGITDNSYPNVNQLSVGCCVGCGNKHAIDITQAIQIVLYGRRDNFKPVSVEGVYGISRVEIGKRQIRGDGSSGAWAAQGVMKYGVLAMEKYPGVDLSAFSPARARQWGDSGMPDDLEPLAKQHVVKSAALVRTYDELDKAIRQGYAGAICSNQGFTMQRDADGFCRASGTWAHCMCACGVRGGTRPGVLIMNSWGDQAHTGPVFPADMPTCCFWADKAVVQRMLAANDTYVMSDLVGFPKREVDTFINAQPARPGLVFTKTSPKRYNPDRAEYALAP